MLLWVVWWNLALFGSILSETWVISVVQCIHVIFLLAHWLLSIIPVIKATIVVLPDLDIRFSAISEFRYSVSIGTCPLTWDKTRIFLFFSPSLSPRTPQVLHTFTVFYRYLEFSQNIFYLASNHNPQVVIQFSFFIF